MLDCIAAGLLLFAFAYFWQGNVAHELAGTGMFLLLVVHNVFHRRWLATRSKGPFKQRERFNTALTFVLLTGMLGLLATSLVISETLFASLRLNDDSTARQIHAGIAYWILIIVAIHLGLRWPLLMAVARKLLGIAEDNAARAALLRLIAIGVAIQGAFSVLTLNLRDRLLFQMSLDWWNFEESVAGFFGHCMAVAGLCMVLTHYTMKWLQRRKCAGSAGRPAAQRSAAAAPLPSRTASITLPRSPATETDPT